jgi:Abnormal spindle-like microcephaly-assoc'd, ASPM-SPD-2-Hydin
MRLPQSILQYLSVRLVHFLTMGLAIALLGVVPGSAAATTPQLTCTPSSLWFAKVVVGQTETLLVTLTNNGQTSVTVSGMAVSNAEFTTSSLSLPLVLLAGQSADLSVSFTPTARGTTGGTIQFTSDASNPTLRLELGGAGTNSEVLNANPTVVSFGQVAIGTSSTVPVVLTNDHSWKITLSGLQMTGSEFSVSGPGFPLTLAAGQSLTVNVAFAPQSVGLTGGSLLVSGAYLIIPLTGTGTGYSVNLFWNSTPGVVGYNVYRSTAPNGTYSRINSTVDANTAYTDGTVASGKTYYYAATSVNSSGLESVRSTPPVQAVIP